MEKVVNVKRGEPYDVYIGRANPRYGLARSKWANPFKLPPNASKGERLDSIRSYEKWITEGEGRRLLEDLGELEGQTLGCWCAEEGGLHAGDDLKCHGQVLLKLLDERRRLQGKLE